MMRILELKNVRFIMALLAVSLMVSCGDDDEETTPEEPDPVAAFSFVATELEVVFTNNSQNATTYEWDFGDGSGTSSVENPTYTYSAAGNYTVSLTASNDSGERSDFTANVSVASTDEKLVLLRGTESKTWKLLRDSERAAMLLAADASLSQIFWPGASNNGARPCVFDDSFTFTESGDYVIEDAGTFWAEFGVFNNVADCDANTTPESCFEATSANMVNECGDDVSAWLGSTHSYSFDTDQNKITLNGMGSWIGIPKLTTTGETIVPVSETTFDAILVDGGASGVDSMFVSFNYSGAYWAFTYVSYENPTDEPALVSVNANFSASTNGLQVTFENTSSGASTFAWDFGDGATSTEENPVHTYAAEGTYSVTLTASDAGGSSQSITKDVTVSSTTLTDPAPTPTEPAANVISVYSDAYTNIDGVNINPNWGQATVTTEQEVATGDMVVKMEGLNYQGIDFAANIQDVSGKTTVHVDIWTASSETFNFFLISDGAQETPYSITSTGGQWDSYDIPLSEYSDVVDLTKIIQFKFDDGGSGASPTIYYDNIYFY